MPTTAPKLINVLLVEDDQEAWLEIIKNEIKDVNCKIMPIVK